MERTLTINTFFFCNLIGIFGYQLNAYRVKWGHQVGTVILFKYVTKSLCVHALHKILVALALTCISSKNWFAAFMTHKYFEGQAYIFTQPLLAEKIYRVKVYVFASKEV